MFLKILQYLQENNCVGENNWPATLLKRDSSTDVFLCILQFFIYLEKHLQTAASDYSFTIAQGQLNVFDSGGPKCLLTKEAPPCLGPRGQKIFEKLIY